LCHPFSVVPQWFVDLFADPQLVQQYGQLPRDRDHGSLLGILSSALGQLQAPAPQITILSQGPHYLVRPLHQQRAQVDPSRHNGLVNYAIWYYRSSPFPVLQLVWPDPAGLFPWEDGFDERYRKRQPTLE
jgi:hypothetical protein